MFFWVNHMVQAKPLPDFPLPQPSHMGQQQLRLCRLALPKPAGRGRARLRVGRGRRRSRSLGVRRWDRWDSCGLHVDYMWVTLDCSILFPLPGTFRGSRRLYMFKKDPGYFRTAGTLESRTPDTPGHPFLANIIASLFASLLYTALSRARQLSGPAILDPMASSPALWALQDPNTTPDKLYR